MMNSLEVRAPFLDIDLVDFVRKIPSRYKFRNRQTKYILKKALEPVLPREILYRSKKGFGIPIGHWLKNGVVKIDADESVGCLNTRFIQSRISEHHGDEADHRAFWWNLWVLDRWAKRG